MLTFDEPSHTYKVNGKITPSVTQIMSRVGVREDSATKFKPINGGFFTGKEVACNFGTAMHKIAECIIKNKKVKYDPQMEPWVQGLRLFLSSHGHYFKFDKTEVMGYSKLYDYCGTWDVEGTYKDRPMIIDWKTATSKSRTWALQTAAYEQLAKETNGNRLTFVRIIVIIKEDNYEFYSYENKLDFNKFLSILNVYKTFK